MCSLKQLLRKNTRISSGETHLLQATGNWLHEGSEVGNTLRKLTHFGGWQPSDVIKGAIVVEVLRIIPPGKLVSVLSNVSTSAADLKGITFLLQKMGFFSFEYDFENGKRVHWFQNIHLVNFKFRIFSRLKSEGDEILVCLKYLNFIINGDDSHWLIEDQRRVKCAVSMETETMIEYTAWWK